jgi:NAD(P)H dehydrogenase (quinone)
MTASHLLVSGATGATGHAAVEALHNTGNRVRALVHQDDARADALRELGAEIVLGDLLDIDSVRAAMEGVNAAYFVYPIVPGLLDATAYFAQAAHEAGVGAIVNLSQRTAKRDSKSHAAQNHWIAERVFDWSGVPVTHLRPTLFAEWLLYPFAVGGIAEQDVLALPFGSGRFFPIAAHDQGQVIATILANPGEHAGQTYKLDGPAELDGNGLAAALSEVLERPIRYQPIPIADFQSAVTADPHLGTFFAQHIGAVTQDLQDGLLNEPAITVEHFTGAAPMSVQDFVRANRDLFTPKQTTAAPA